MIKDDLSVMLDELADLPEKSVNSDWLDEIDPDLRARVANDEEGGERIANLSEIKRRQKVRKVRAPEKVASLAMVDRAGIARSLDAVAPSRLFDRDAIGISACASLDRWRCRSTSWRARIVSARR